MIEEWRYAADAARITDEDAGSKDRKHTSGGVFVVVDSNFGSSHRQKKKEQSARFQEVKEELPKKE